MTCPPAPEGEALIALVREIADRVISGESAEDIATDLNTRGVPVPDGIAAGRRFVGVSDIARMRGCSPQRADELTRHPKFPAPLPGASQRLWWEDEVQTFLDTPRRTGRPRKQTGNSLK